MQIVVDQIDEHVAVGAGIGGPHVVGVIIVREVDAFLFRGGSERGGGAAAREATEDAKEPQRETKTHGA